METITQQLQDIINSYRILHCEERPKMVSRYLTQKNRRKALFYINPQKKKIVFGIGHHGTKILETLPTLPMLADETKVAVIKFFITKPEDIEFKAIRFLIEQCIDIAGKTFFKMEHFSWKKIKNSKK